MKKIVMVCICTSLLLAIPFMSLEVQPKPLLPENRIGVPTPDNGDPDGPFEGGLDDPTDWIYLLSAIGNLLILPGFAYAMYMVIKEVIEGEGSPIGIIWNSLILYWTMRYGVGSSFVEAFDINDIDGDGC